MSQTTTPVLPQNDTPENRQLRAQELEHKQSEYNYAYPEIVDHLPMAASLPNLTLSLDWILQLVDVVLTLGENLVGIILPNTITFDLQIPLPDPAGQSASRASRASRASSTLTPKLAAPANAEEAARQQVALRFKDRFAEHRQALLGLAARAVDADARPPFRAPPAGGSVLAFLAPPGAQRTTETSTIGGDILAWLEKLVDLIVEAVSNLGKISGRATDIRDYDQQFSALPLPWPAGAYQSDEVFAQMRVAGPNPVMLERVTAADLPSVPVTDEQLGSVTGEAGATLRAFIDAGRLYVVDYKALAGVAPGQLPPPGSQQKYSFSPRAFFYVPPGGAGPRSLRPLAIQSAQAPGSATFFPSDGAGWSVAKVIVNIADGNYHEAISHLGLTHLLTEPFVLATLRQLDPQHPLNLLLMPHFNGTLFINYEAQTSLIVDGGPVDKLLAGTAAASRQLAADAVKAVRYNRSFLPEALAARGVDSPEALPDYPYRDDALAVWTAIHDWVLDYVSLYYAGPEDVSGDYELQGWVQELVEKGRLQDIGEGRPDEAPRIETVEYLAKLLTQIIFTGSAQHAAVNFQQRLIMAYTPAMPLAGFAPFPAPPGAPETQVLDMMPPLEESLLQQLVGTALGGIYYTVLGQYGGQFDDPRARAALARFQQRLQAVEKHIHAENALGERTPYSLLLPSAIPQSINI